MMRITDVRVRKVEKEGKMKAVVSITIDDEFVVHDIKVIEGVKGLFIAMPSRKAADGEFRDIAHPINSETRDHIQNIILEEFTKERIVEKRLFPYIPFYIARYEKDITSENNIENVAGDLEYLRNEMVRLHKKGN